MTTLDFDLLSNDEKNIPDFIVKLYSILQNPQFQNTISWEKNGYEIEIKHQKRLETLILPVYFRHQKIQSFIRQLNMYKFKKVNKVLSKTKSVFFKNQLFRKDNPKLLHLIKRRKKGQLQQQSQLDKGLSQYREFVRQNISKVQYDICALRKKHPQIACQLLSILNSTQVLTGQSFQQNSDTDESEQSVKQQVNSPQLLLSNKNLLNFQSIRYFDSKCSIDVNFIDSVFN